jgi:L-amino acid N-acyltransferase YncA
MPAPDVVIRTSRPGDVEQILALYVAVAAEGRWIGRELPMDQDAARTRIAESVDAPGHYTTVAELTDLGSTEVPALDQSYGRSVGHLHLGVAPYGVAELGMQVAAVLRGRGIGRALLDDAIGWARAQAEVHKI